MNIDIFIIFFPHFFIVSLHKHKYEVVFGLLMHVRK